MPRATATARATSTTTALSFSFRCRTMAVSDRRYSIFGEIIRGIEVIDMIAKMPPVTNATTPSNRSA
ncbi:MAG: peptidylprolyl isomerase [Nitrospira sp.]|nr:peptidylprolyl isomerase [Nitrospira sp.]